MMTTFQIIEKEDIKTLHFPANDVVNEKADKAQRQVELTRALSLGNLEHGKIRIYFEDATSKKMVETTVWALTDNRVVLKQGIGIPINRIYKSS